MSGYSGGKETAVFTTILSCQTDGQRKPENRNRSRIKCKDSRGTESLTARHAYFGPLPTDHSEPAGFPPTNIKPDINHSSFSLSIPAMPAALPGRDHGRPKWRFDMQVHAVGRLSGGFRGTSRAGWRPALVNCGMATLRIALAASLALLWFSCLPVVFLSSLRLAVGTSRTPEFGVGDSRLLGVKPG